MNYNIGEVDQAVKFIKNRITDIPRVGIVLGSGWGTFAERVEKSIAIPFTEIPHFGATHVAGHKGQLVVGTIGKIPVAVLQGRIHYYEGHSLERVAFAVRTLKQLGIRDLVLTNASGGLKSTMKPGDFMLINDHINLTGQNVLIGRNDEADGPRFPDMNDAYDPAILKILAGILRKHKTRFSSGVYCGVTGPTYETPAEIRYFQKIGAHAVGMSTVHETIAAVHQGLHVAGIACITNLGAGMKKEKLHHQDVTKVAKHVEAQFTQLLLEAIPLMDARHTKKSSRK